jgi:hypothetical protein
MSQPNVGGSEVYESQIACDNRLASVCDGTQMRELVEEEFDEVPVAMQEGVGRAATSLWSAFRTVSS